MINLFLDVLIFPLCEVSWYSTHISWLEGYKKVSAGRKSFGGTSYR